jgi:hypothetical protein
MANTTNSMTSNQFSNISRVLPATNRVWTETETDPASKKELVYPAMVDRSHLNTNGNVRNGLNRLVKILERRIDRQVLAAQIRAYDAPSEPAAKPRQL